MNLLVTGAAGFIGANFVHFLLGECLDCRVVGLDKLTYAGNLENLSGLPEAQRDRFEFVKGDINDRGLLADLFEKRVFDYVINFAAETHVDRSIHDPEAFLTTNVLGTQSLLDICRRFWACGASWLEGRKFIQVSTDEVYGSLGPTGLFTEETPLDPRSPYSTSKAAADRLVRASFNTHGLPAAITRCCNNYGPYQFPEKLIPLMIRNSLLHQELPVYGDGRQVRDWIHVLDHCRAVERVMAQAAPGSVYNVGASVERENIWVVRKIVEILREITCDAAIHDGLIRHIQDRPGHDRRYGIDATKLRTELGWEPRVEFEDGLRKTVEWYLDHRDWTERVISGDYLAFYEKNYAKRLKNSSE